MKSPPGIDEVKPPREQPYWYILILMDTLSPTERYYVEVSDYHTGLVPPLEFIETLTPIGNESITLPKMNFSFSNPCPPVQQVQSHLYYQENIIAQQTQMFADYHATPETRVFMQFYQTGVNQWREGYDDWRYNSYDDSSIWEHEGSGLGWHLVSGEFSAGTGSYPDPSHLDWKNILKTSGADFCL